MKTFSKTLLLLALLISACGSSNSDEAVSYPNPSYPNDNSYPNSVSAPTQSPSVENPYAPAPDDATLTRGEAFIESAEILTLESYPLQFMLNLKGNLPTPCNQLRIAVNPPNTENKVEVTVYSVIDPNKMCVQALAPFEVNFSLGSFPTGSYSVWVNGNKVADFQS